MYWINRRLYQFIILNGHWEALNALPCGVLKFFQVQAITYAEVYMMVEEWNISKINWTLEKNVQTADALSAVTVLRGFREENGMTFCGWVITVILVQA